MLKKFISLELITIIILSLFDDAINLNDDRQFDLIQDLKNCYHNESIQTDRIRSD